jgi:hypothetical protein
MDVTTEDKEVAWFFFAVLIADLAIVIYLGVTQ